MKQGTDAVNLTVQEAFAAILLGAVAADGNVTSDEGLRVHHALTSMKLYSERSPEALQAMVGKVMELIEYHGIAPVVAWAARTIPAELRGTAFANAADLVLSDRRVRGHERSLLDELQAVLQLDDAMAVTIVEVLRTKNKG
jgi:hypothetical protein